MGDADSKPLVWITGSTGLIGGQILRMAPIYAPKFNAVGFTRAQADLTDFAAVRRLFREQRPALIIHCAAISQSPICQSQPELAKKVNVDATANLAELAAESGFIFFSSDLVFDGAKGNYVETDPLHPLSIYAETKAVAESLVLRNPRHTIVRTSLTGGVSARSRGFNEEMRAAWKEGKKLRLFSDEYRCPIDATITARAIWDLVRQNSPGGIFHLAGSERLSRLQIGQLVAARHPELHPRIEACSLREYQGAPRPPDCSMNVGKIQKLLSFKLPGLTQWLANNPALDF